MFKRYHLFYVGAGATLAIGFDILQSVCLIVALALIEVGDLMSNRAS